MQSSKFTSSLFLGKLSLPFIALTILLFPAILFSQKDPMKFGKVPAEDLSMTSYPLDTSAAAVVLGDYGTLKFQFRDDDIQYQFHRHRRIKILKRAGFDQGDIEIPFYSKNRFETVLNIKALVITPDGTVTDVSKREVFDEKVTENWSRKRFTIPNLTEGCIIEYEYDTNSKSIFTLPTWTFQEDIPVRWSELRTEIPEWYQYTFIRQGPPLDIDENSEVGATFQLPSWGGPSENVTAKVRKSRWAMKDVPALKEEPFITTMDDYYARIRFQLNSVKYPNSPGENVMSSWPQVMKDLLAEERFGAQLKSKRNYGKAWEALQPLLPTSGTQEEKCKAVYDFVCSNVNEAPGGGIFVRTNLNDCFEKKKGYSHEINLLLVALLREAGIEACPVLVSNRDHGMMFPLYPFLDQFNNVLAMATLDGNYTILDAAGPPKPMGFPSEEALNGLAWAMMEPEPQWIELQALASTNTYLLNLTFDETGTMDGTITIGHTGYEAFDKREELKTEPSEGFVKKRIIEWFPDAIVGAESIEGAAPHDKSLKMTASCQLPNMAQITGDFAYISPAVMSEFGKNPFKLENRTYPVDITYPLTERIILNLALPEGYAVEEMPESAIISTEDNGCKFQFQLSQKPDGIQLTSTLQVNKLRFESEEYPALRNFFSLVEQKMGEQVVLKKKT